MANSSSSLHDLAEMCSAAEYVMTEQVARTQRARDLLRIKSDSEAIPDATMDFIFQNLNIFHPSRSPILLNCES